VDRSFVVAVCLAAATGCSAPSADEDEVEVEAGEDALIGGAPATVADFPSTLYLKRGCTAAKVAPKMLLTAAHCVLDPSTLDLKYGVSKPIELSREPSKGFTSHAVAAVHVHGAWTRACQEEYCGSSSVTATIDAADVAVVELAADLADVPAAAIDTTPLAARDRVTVLGFGCTEGVLAEDKRGTITLKFAETSIVPASRAVHAGSPATASSLAQIGGIYAMTPGPARVKSAGGLCPGDSGGPLYRKRGDTLVVVGVNANYTLRPGEKDLAGIPVTNWHTRLDDRSRHGIAAWLRSVGAVREPRR
jgi:secreted trypsin-like serine protease